MCGLPRRIVREQIWSSRALPALRRINNSLLTKGNDEWRRQSRYTFLGTLFMLSALQFQTTPASLTPAVVTAVFLVLLAFVSALFAVSLYNGLVRARRRTCEAWSDIEVQLKRRANLIPNLVETVRGYAADEHEVFAELLHARGALTKASGPIASAVADQALTDALQGLMAAAENYPRLRAAKSFARLQQDLADSKEKMAYARHFYNRSAHDYNTRLQSFPGNQFAAWFDFEAFPLFAADPAVSQDLQVSYAGG
jgi:LemA protein